MEDYRPRRLDFYIGGGMGPAYQVEWDDRRLVYRFYENREEKEVKFLNPSEEQWIGFWDQMEKLRVWGWFPKYPNPEVMDGTSWSVNLGYGERSVRSGGTNNFPKNGAMSNETEPSPEFRKFCAAVRRLLGDLPFS